MTTGPLTPPPRRRSQFRLRTLLLLVAGQAIRLGIAVATRRDRGVRGSSAVQKTILMRPTSQLICWAVALLHGAAANSVFAAAGPCVEGRFPGRIAYRCDGNHNDPDDWAASPATLAILAEAGLNERLAHFGDNGIPPLTDPAWKAFHAASVRGGAARNGFDQGRFCDCRTDRGGAGIAKTIADSTAADPLYFAAKGSRCRWAPSVAGAAQGAARESPGEGRGRTSPEVAFRRGAEIQVDVQGDSAGAGKLNYVQFNDVAAAAADLAADYFPPPESAGGWRTLNSAEDRRQIAGVDPAKLAALQRWLLDSDQRDFAAVVVRRGYVVLEVERGDSAQTDARRVASVSKAICATVLAIAAEHSQHGRTPRRMTFDDRAFDFIPQAQPLSDPRKANITIRQLLNHTSGITPEATGAKNQGPWRHVLGHDGDPLTANLAFAPGSKCGYSSFALYHASLVCETVTGKPYDQFAIEALFRPLGVEHWTFEFFDGGGPDGETRYGRHPSHGIGMPARDLARIAYCLLRGGRWQDQQVVPPWFVEETAAPTHDVQEPELRFHRAAQSFSHGWELPARLTDGQGDGIPADARYKPGSGGQLIAFVPSLDLVITRQTGGSGSWDYEQYLRLACEAVAR